MTPQELQKVLDELETSRSSRKRAWENLQELRWVLKDSAGMEAADHPARRYGSPDDQPGFLLAVVERSHMVRHRRNVDAQPPADDPKRSGMLSHVVR
jgi:hypothetical protein